MSEDPIKEIEDLVMRIAYENDYELMHILEGLFHSQEMNDEVEAERACPFDDPIENTMYESHTELAHHILFSHPDHLDRYVEFLRNTLDHPANSRVGDSFNAEIVGSTDPENMCAYCGKRTLGKMDFMKQFREKHRGPIIVAQHALNERYKNRWNK